MMSDIAQLLSVHGKEDNKDNEKVENLSSHLKAYYYVFHEISPYAEVRSSVPHTDDSTLPSDTFRTWFIGLFFVALFAGTNQVTQEKWFDVLIYVVLLNSMARCGDLCRRHSGLGISLRESLGAVASDSIVSGI